eukprot:scaffold20688_cov65-Phaeocystis_antarctica.AAC.1
MVVKREPAHHHGAEQSTHGWPRGVIGCGSIGGRTWVALRRRQARLLSAVLVAPSAFLGVSPAESPAELPR